MNMPEEDFAIFTSIYEKNIWGSSETFSGPGSTVAGTAKLRQALERTFSELNIRSLVDAPCGDMNWMRHLKYPFESYIGIDLVASIIEKLRQDASFSRSYNFQVGNIVTDILPKADALLCRDCLVHLPSAMISEALEKLKRGGFRYLFTTTFPACEKNDDCKMGYWRPLNMQKAPFNLPPPTVLLPEYPGATWANSDKSIGVWQLN
jgi:hypothetical protein